MWDVSFVADNLAFISIPGSETIHAGNPIHFHCIVHIDPADLENLNVVWFKDDSPLFLDPTRMRTEVLLAQKSNISLIIDSLRASDSGQYACYISNEIEILRHGFQLIVKGKSELNYLNASLMQSEWKSPVQYEHFLLYAES